MSRVLLSPGAQKAVAFPPARPLEWRFSSVGAESLSPAAWRPHRCRASGSGQRLWMSIAGSSFGDA